MPESRDEKIQRVLETLFAMPGVWPDTPSPAPPPPVPLDAPWRKSRSMSLRQYRMPPEGAVSRALGLQSYPSRPILENFMMEGASDAEILSRFQVIPPWTMRYSRDAVNERLRMLNRFGRRR